MENTFLLNAYKKSKSLLLKQHINIEVHPLIRGEINQATYLYSYIVAYIEIMRFKFAFLRRILRKRGLPIVI